MVNSSIPLRLLLLLLEFTRKTNISVLSKRKVFCIEKSSTSISSPNPNLLHTCSPGLPFLVITHTRHSLFLPSKLDSLPWLLPYWNKSQSFEEIGICKWLFFYDNFVSFKVKFDVMYVVLLEFSSFTLISIILWSWFTFVLLHWIQSFSAFVDHFWANPHKKKLKLYTHMHKKDTIFIHI